MNTVNESISTVDDGAGTVNERLSAGGPGPEGQPDTVTESLSAQDDEASAGEPSAEPKRPAAKKSTAKAKG